MDGGDDTVLTKTDANARGWAITDDVVRLSQRPPDAPPYILPSHVDRLSLGTSPSNDIPIADPSGQTSRAHAVLVRTGSRWIWHDAGSRNGTWVDGERRSIVELEPGIEIGVGNVQLIVESTRLIELRGFLARLLGWRTDRSEAVDQALRAVRFAANRRYPLHLVGDGDLVFVARGLHRRAFGSQRPFAIVNRRRGRRKATVRSAESYADGMTAIRATAGGTVCVQGARLPKDYRQMQQALKSQAARFQLIVCGSKEFTPSTIEIPGLSDRNDELELVILEFAEDAVEEFDARRSGFTRGDRAWVRKHESRSLAEIETATRRLVAIRATPNLAQAAALLGMAPPSLRRWVRRRRLPMRVNDE